MAELEEQINRVTCKFNEQDLEDQYKEMEWEKTREWKKKQNKESIF